MSYENRWNVFSLSLFITHFFESQNHQNWVMDHEWYHPNNCSSVGPTSFGSWVMKTGSYHSKLTASKHARSDSFSVKPNCIIPPWFGHMLDLDLNVFTRFRSSCCCFSTCLHSLRCLKQWWWERQWFQGRDSSSMLVSLPLMMFVNQVWFDEEGDIKSSSIILVFKSLNLDLVSIFFSMRCQILIDLTALDLFFVFIVRSFCHWLVGEKK